MTLAELAAKLGVLAELIDEVNSALNNAGPGVLVPLNSTWSAESARDAAELVGSQAPLVERIDADPDVVTRLRVRAAYTAQRTHDLACTCGHPWHDGPCEHTRDGQPDDGWTPLCDCRRAEPDTDR